MSEFLIRTKNRSGARAARTIRVAHVWTGADTACRMFSTGGMNRANYERSADRRGLPICLMCRNVMRKRYRRKERGSRDPSPR